MTDAAASPLAPLLSVALLEAVGTAGIGVLIIVDTEHGLAFRYANRPAAALLGYTPDELARIPVLENVTPPQRPLVQQLADSFRAGQPVPSVLEFELVHRDGSLVASEFVMGYVTIPEGLAYVMVLRTASAHQQAQLSLLEADRIGLVGALAAGFAHEINNPLTSVLLNLRSLRKQLGAMSEPTQRQALRCLDDITTGAERIASNVRALQTLATRSATQDVDLAAIVSSALRLAAPTLEPRAHVIRQIFPVRPVTGDESRIGQAVLAMMLFSSSGFAPDTTTGAGRIEILVEERPPHIVVEVSDNGRDLTAEEIRGAFDPFFRSSARGAGVGVGLGVARSVATTLGGDVTLVPRSGGGAVITMRLPAASS